MANETLTLIQSAQVNASTTAITFSSIPQTFTDLIIKMSVRGTQASINQSYTLRFNGSTSTFTGIRMYGSGGGTPASDATAQPEAVGASATANTFSNHEVTIPNYTSANYKSYSIEGAAETNATTTYIVLAAGLWSTASAITSFSINTTDLFVQHTTMSLYGVAKYGVTPAGTAKASGGDVVTNDGTYWIHQFFNSGVFTPFSALTCDYLVVAGGGSGGSGLYANYAGGGGGAGGLRSTVTATGGGGTLETALSLTAQSYPVTVGAGGRAGTSGSNSVLSTITSTGGGKGSGSGAQPAGTGGSGGGNEQGIAGAAGTQYQGFAGGGTQGGGLGSGGGGAGEAGGTDGFGQGGDGVAVSITGSSVTYAGGGGSGQGGQAGGSGGGGSGTSNGVGVSGTVNLGGGGGGATANAGGFVGGAGGSGIVIIRYAM